MGDAGPRPLLEVAGLAKRFGGVTAVANLTMSVSPGTVVGLIGPNGAGKSTAVDIISGFMRPDAGRITFDGTQVQGWPAHKVSARGMVRTFQTPREWAGLTVMENMLLAAEQGNRNKAWRALLDRPRLRKLEEADRVRARQWLERFELLSQRDDLAGELSGGQKRLLEFARIAMRRPLLVLLDEPTAGVNPVLRGKIESAILGLQETGIAALLIEHDLGFVERACTLIYVMDQGSAIAHGTLEELRHVPAVVDAYLGSAEAVVGG